MAVSIRAATLTLFRGGVVANVYPVSTSLRPPSQVAGSLGTPRGLHEVAERIGGGQPPGVVFSSRVPTGRHFRELPEAEAAGNLVTTRILWLRGLEPGFNAGPGVDTYDRYVYIHGTNHEDRIGRPASGGCVLLRNLDVIALHDAVRTGDLVWIAD